MKNFEGKLAFAIEKLQSFGRLYFTRRQIFYEFCRSLSLKKYVPLIGKLSGFVQPYQTVKTPVSWTYFDKNLQNFELQNKIEGLLETSAKTDFSPLISSDLMLYGLPKVLICESNEIAQMLRANQLHLQTPCGILSLDEAKPLPVNFQKMIGHAEYPQVFYLHDANLRSFLELPNLRKRLLLNEQIPLKILGLRPVHAQRLRLFSEISSAKLTDFQDFDFLDESENKWLATGNSAEISAVTPVRLLRVLRRLILRTAVPASDWQIKLPDKNLGFM